MHVSFATQCAWRAIYVRRGPRLSPFHPNIGKQVCYLGIDPSASKGPQLFGGWHIGRWCRRFRFTLPHVRWGFVARCGYARPVAWLYQRQQALLIRLDGRYSLRRQS